jgi:hypothetical protein
VGNWLGELKAAVRSRFVFWTLQVTGDGALATEVDRTEAHRVDDEPLGPERLLVRASDF